MGPVVMHEHDQDAHLKHLGAVEQHHGPHHQHVEAPSPMTLSAPMHDSTPLVRRYHARTIVPRNDDDEVFGPYGSDDGRGHDLHVVQHGVQQQRGPEASPVEPHGAQMLQQDAGSARRVARAVTQPP